jgi:hypothetical protein
VSTLQCKATCFRKSGSADQTKLTPALAVSPGTHAGFRSVFERNRGALPAPVWEGLDPRPGVRGTRSRRGRRAATVGDPPDRPARRFRGAVRPRGQ